MHTSFNISCMRQRLIVVFALSLVTLSGITQTKEEKLKNLMNAYFGVNKLNGTVLVTQHGKILLNEGLGYSNIADSIMNETATIFQVGSVTKQFTAAAILKLQEMNQLNVQDKLSKYFPGFPKSDSISIEHLLTHTSGIFNYTDDRVFMQTQATKPVTRETMIALLKEKPFNFSPGTNWAYSNSNYILLGYIIQTVTKKPYEHVIKEFILTPLQMHSTGFDFAGLKSRKAKGYKNISENGGEESVEFDSTVSFAAGAMYSTTGDLYKWQVGLSKNQVLQKSSFDKATSPFKNKYGYGVYIDSIYGKRLIAHGGLAFGFTSYMGRITEDDVCIVILSNMVNVSISQVAKDILSVLYDRPYKLPEAPRAITLDVQVLKKYTGIYELAPQFSIAFTVEDDQLFAQVASQPKLRLHAQKEDLFFIKGADIQVEFKKDASGSITGLILTEDGRVTPGKKVK